jgi:hypothetical protein
LLVVCFILFSGTAAMAVDVTQEAVNAAVLNGQNYLKAQQTPAIYSGGVYVSGGYWPAYSSFSVATTASAVAALLETGVPRTDQHVIDGINYLKSRAQGNGSIISSSGNRPTYETGMALVAIGLYNDPDPNSPLRTIAQNAINYLLTYQVTSGSYLGGWYYYPGYSYADLSNTQFAVMGMYYGSNYLGLSISGQAWVTRLKTYLINSAVAGGGFCYEPGGGYVYFSMTGAGFWCAVMAGVEADPAIAPLLNAAKTWLNANYDWDHDAYYIYAMAKGLAAAVGTSTLIGTHNWVQDMKNWLVDPANGNITTIGRDTQSYWDMSYGTILSTSWVIMSLGFADPNTPSPTKRIADNLDNPIKGTVTLSTENGVLISGAIRQPVANASKGITVKLPIGAMSFKLLNMRPGGSTVLKIDLPVEALNPDNPDSFVNPDGTFNPANVHWFKIQGGAWKSNAAIPIVLEYNDTTVPIDWHQGGYLEVTLTDNGPGDADPTLGTYEDPGAPGIGGAEPDVATETDRATGSGGAGCFITTVGTSNAGGFMALALVLLLGLAVFIRRR